MSRLVVYHQPKGFMWQDAEKCRGITFSHKRRPAGNAGEINCLRNISRAGSLVVACPDDILIGTPLLQSLGQCRA